jgi:hypothetical protein
MEPITLAAIGGLALTEGIKFLYGQAGEILKRRRGRNDAASGAEAGSEPIEIETPDVVDGTLNPVTIDAEAANELTDELRALRAALADYAQDIEPVDLSDERVVRATSVLRDAIEAIIGQRITFKGEDREPTGTPIVTGRARARVLRGRATGVEAEHVTGGRITGEAEAETVEEGGDLAGVRLKSIGNKVPRG